MSIDKIIKTIELKVGDYIRTDDGLIGKVVSEPYEYKDSIGCDIDFGNNDVFNEYEMCQRIIKSSPNIIDLIEEGDYVNGKKVCCFRKENCDYDIGFQYNDDFGEWYGIDADEIESIVTKEQIKTMEYKIER